MSLDQNFVVEVTVRGPEYQGRTYADRDTLARLELPSDPTRAFDVFSETLRALTSPQMVVEEPDAPEAPEESCE